MGRPTLLTEEMIKKAQEYLESAIDNEYTFQKMSGKTDGYEEKVRTNLPTVVGLALYLGVHRDTLYEWAKENDAFSDTLTRVKQLQEQRLVDGGLSGRYNPMITKLILATNHGYRENQDVTSDGKAIKGNAIIFTEFDGANSQ